MTCPREAGALAWCPGQLGKAIAAGLTGGHDGQTELSLEAESLSPAWQGDGLGVGTKRCADASFVPLGQSST